jgi:hypothetical protein
MAGKQHQSDQPSQPMSRVCAAARDDDRHHRDGPPLTILAVLPSVIVQHELSGQKTLAFW